MTGYVVTSYEDGTHYLWNINSGLFHILTGHNGFITDAVRIGNYLITASRDKTIKTWDLNQIEKGAVSTIITQSRANALVTDGKKNIRWFI